MLKRVLAESELHNRASTVIAEFLFRRLIVPRVYLEAPWPGPRERVNVLARDRAGTGDLHVAEIVVVHTGTGLASKISQILARLAAIPSHYKYLGIFHENGGLFVPTEHALYDSSGFGRIGVIRVTEDRAENLKAESLISAERFRPSADIYRKADKLLGRLSPDFEIRDY